LKAFAAGNIAELHVAFSRGSGPRTYVQDLIAAQQDRIWSLIGQGAIIYVCGDGGKMEPGVKAALTNLYRQRKPATEDEALRWIDQMGAQNRYVLDVWAGS
jgi:cytochrome P450/NADPH-cytochrome P450 reductase